MWISGVTQKASLLKKWNDKFWDIYSPQGKRDTKKFNIEDWYYVPTTLNLADDLTRFTGFQTLTNQSWWCTGPELLLQDNIKSVHLNLTKTASVTLNDCTNPSVQLEPNADKITNKEQDRTDTSISYSKSDNQKQHILIYINWYHYSSFITLIRYLSWILKLKLNSIKLKTRIERENFRFLKTAEINQSRIILLRLAQLGSFPNEHNLRWPSKLSPSTSKLIGLNPIFDEGLINSLATKGDEAGGGPLDLFFHIC